MVTINMFTRPLRVLCVIAIKNIRREGNEYMHLNDKPFSTTCS